MYYLYVYCVGKYSVKQMEAQTANIDTKHRYEEAHLELMNYFICIFNAIL